MWKSVCLFNIQRATQLCLLSCDMFFQTCNAHTDGVLNRRARNGSKLDLFIFPFVIFFFFCITVYTGFTFQLSDSNRTNNSFLWEKVNLLTINVWYKTLRCVNYINNRCVNCIHSLWLNLNSWLLVLITCFTFRRHRMTFTRSFLKWNVWRYFHNPFRSGVQIILHVFT